MLTTVARTLPSLAVGAVLGLRMLLTVLALDSRGGKKGRPMAQALTPVVEPPAPSSSSLSADDEDDDGVSAPAQLVSERTTHTQFSSEQVLEAVTSTRPEDPESATFVLYCESAGATHPDTWALDQPDGGPLQINKQTWAEYFEAKYGWTWSQIVRDIAIHLAAAREIYDKTGDWRRWACSPSVARSN